MRRTNGRRDGGRRPCAAKGKKASSGDAGAGDADASGTDWDGAWNAFKRDFIGTDAKMPNEYVERKDKGMR